MSCVLIVKMIRDPAGARITGRNLMSDHVTFPHVDRSLTSSVCRLGVGIYGSLLAHVV